MLNLRQFNKSEHSQASSGAQRLSQLSAPNFRISSGRLGNIGEPLDHGQAERYTYGEDNEVQEMVPHSVEDAQDVLHSEMTGDRRADTDTSSDPSRQGE